MSYQTRYKLRLIHYKWDPEPDITAYELAICLPALLDYNKADLSMIIQQLPPEARRHFSFAPNTWTFTTD